MVNPNNIMDVSLRFFPSIKKSPPNSWIDIVKGMRILFTADTDILVKGRIFEVDIIKFSGQASGTQTQITLKEVSDSVPQENEVILALSGEIYKGRMLYFSNGTWQLTQEKTYNLMSSWF
mgnify:CR=1 FL=1